MKKKNQVYKRLELAGELVAREAKKHFKEDGWDLDFNFLVTDVFYKVFGEHLEGFLLRPLSRSRTPLYLNTGKRGNTVLSKKPNSKGLKFGGKKK